MPTITVEGPALDIAKKRLLVKALYDSARAVYNIDDIVIVLHENPLENMGVGGELVSDRHKEATGFKKKF
jgi:4-oxalocrotonate tautomerase family enzyme